MHNFPKYDTFFPSLNKISLALEKYRSEIANAHTFCAVRLAAFAAPNAS